MKANYEEKLNQASTSTFEGGSLYDMNKILVKEEPAITAEELDLAQKELIKFFEQKQTYSMLLCHEARDYTLFRVPENSFLTPVACDVIECLRNRGTIISIETLPDKCIEAWIRKEDKECYCYYLFPYDLGVLDYTKEGKCKDDLSCSD